MHHRNHRTVRVAALLALVGCLLGGVLAPLDAQAAPSAIVALAAGTSHTCALTSFGGVLCWGEGGNGQIGDGAAADRPVPVAVSGLESGVTAIAAGGGHTCALTVAGGVKCWGWNASGQLGDGTTTMRLAPVDVSGLTSGVAAIAAGYQHTCAVMSAGGAKCSGQNTAGQLGDGTTTARLTPVDVSGLTSGVAAIAAGTAHTCALTAAGGVKCWGNNAWGQLGDATNAQRAAPVDVIGLTGGASAVDVGFGHTCAVIAAGGVLCWGDNSSGGLGDGTTIDRSTIGVVGGLSSPASALVLGAGHSCARMSAGGVTCWGENINGELGDGTIDRRSTAADVSGLTGVTAIAGGDYHTCALLAAGGVRCWGWNLSGQLGDGTATNRTTPVAVQFAPAFSSAAPPAPGTFGQSYAYIFSATGVPEPSFSLVSGGLPPGLSLDAASGALGGTPTQAGDFSFNVQASSGAGSSSRLVTLTISKAPLTVTAEDATMASGAALPVLSARFTGFVNGETLATSGVSGSPICATSAAPSSPPGTYPITCAVGTLAASNYIFSSFAAGTLTVIGPFGFTISLPVVRG